MKVIGTYELRQNLKLFLKRTLKEPIAITHRDKGVVAYLLSREEYERLTK